MINDRDMFCRDAGITQASVLSCLQTAISTEHVLHYLDPPSGAHQKGVPDPESVQENCRENNVNCQMPVVETAMQLGHKASSHPEQRVGFCDASTPVWMSHITKRQTTRLYQCKDAAVITAMSTVSV